MSGSAALTGKDTTIIASRVLANFGNGDIVVLDFPNNLVEGKAGKNGNVIYAYNASGNMVNVTVKVLAGSADDKFMNTKMIEYKQDPASFVLLKGEFIKRVGDGAGNVSEIVYMLDGGIIQKMVPSKENIEGDTEQALAVYTMLFANTDRVIA
jgi:hypothetical protein